MSTFTEIVTTYKEQFEAFQAKIAAEGKNQLAMVFSSFFAENPTVEAIRWEQYAPHFNDGDACEFSAHEPSYKFVGKDDIGYNEDGWVDGWSLQSDADYAIRQRAEDGIPESIRPSCALLFEGLQAAEQAMKVVFGDDSQVTATREGFEIEEFDHD